MPFKFIFPADLGGEEFTHLDFTGREIVELEDTLKVEWWTLNPLRSMKHGLAMLAVLLGRRRESAEVEQIIDRLTVGDLHEIITFTPDDGLPTEFVDGMPDPKAGAGA